MNQTDIEYWEQRSAQRMWEHMDDAEKTAKEIAKSYQNASRYLNRQIDEVFVRFKNKHNLSTTEAKRLLNMMHDSTSIQSLKLALQQSKDNVEKAELLKMLESPAYSARIKRFEEMQEQLDVIMNNVYQTEKSLSTKHYVELASDSYYRSIFDIQKGTGLGFQFAHVSQDEIDKLLHSKWSGINYTQRIWGNTNRLAKTLKEEMLVSLMTGRSNLATTEVFREKFNVGAYEARRLVRTESAFIANEMEQQAYKECDIEKYMFVATLDKRTSEICQKKDHKVFAVKERSQGVNCPPMHPFCRSTTIAYLDDETISNMERLATDDETGEKKKIPADITYNQWIKSIDGDIIQSEDGTLLKPIESENEHFNMLLTKLKDGTVKYLPVKKYKKKLGQDKIISKLAGGDTTSGSCASVGLAYIGQRQGWDVLDFRGGDSRDFFSRSVNLRTLSKADGIKTLESKGKSSVTIGNNFLKQCEKGKEYYLCVGRHAAIVRRTNQDILQYLELQSSTKNGWTDFNKNPRYTLATRFGCSSTSSYASQELDFMIDIDNSDFNNDDFKSLLGYINTSKLKQKKGVSGYAK